MANKKTTAKKSAKIPPAKGKGRAAAGKSKRKPPVSKGSAEKKGVGATKVAKSSSGKSRQHSEAGKKGAPKKGERRGGRAKGTPNKLTVEFQAFMEGTGFDPREVVVKIARGDEMKASVVVEGMPREVTARPTLELQARCAMGLMEYLWAKRKAIEVSGPEGEPVKVILMKLEDLVPSGVGVAKT